MITEEMTTGRMVQAKAGKYLTFKLAHHEFGLAIQKIVVILKLKDLVSVPPPPAIAGDGGSLRGKVMSMVDLRGRVLPVVDLRLAFGMDARASTYKTCVIMVQVARGNGRLNLGIIVDEVTQVLDVESHQIAPPPEFGAVVDAAFILGLGQVGPQGVTLLDLDRILKGGEMADDAQAA